MAVAAVVMGDDGGSGGEMVAVVAGGYDVGSGVEDSSRGASWLAM